MEMKDFENKEMMERLCEALEKIQTGEMSSKEVRALCKEADQNLKRQRQLLRELKGQL